MILRLLQKKERMIGISEANASEYGVPLNKKMGNDFLILLIGLMSFLGILSLSLIFVLSAITERWSSGLENKATIEIHPIDSNGISKSRPFLLSQAESIRESLDVLETVKSVKVLQSTDLQTLLKPWIENIDIDLAALPIPVLISVELEDNVSTIEVDAIKDIIQLHAPGAMFDTHEEWLSNVLDLVSSIRLASIIVASIIALIIFVTISGAIKSRMAVFDKELTLLHHMGASDEYISKQFERFSLLMSAKGVAIGSLLAFFILGAIRLLSDHADQQLVPNFELSMAHIFLLISAPIAIVALAVTTARITTIRSLQAMP